MTKTNYSPTRMERLHQRERLHTATRAHDLLQDKADEMMRTFNQLYQQTLTLRTRVERELNTALQQMLVAGTQMSPAALQAALTTNVPSITLTCSTRNIMGLIVPHVEIAATALSPFVGQTTPPAFDQGVNRLQQLTTALLELANMEKTCTMLANELQKVRRRINSLEYNLMPTIEETIKAITMKLDENQRETQVRTMKVKAMQTEQPQ